MYLADKINVPIVMFHWCKLFICTYINTFFRWSINLRREIIGILQERVRGMPRNSWRDEEHVSYMTFPFMLLQYSISQMQKNQFFEWTHVQLFHLWVISLLHKQTILFLFQFLCSAIAPAPFVPLPSCSAEVCGKNWGTKKRGKENHATIINIFRNHYVKRSNIVYVL